LLNAMDASGIERVVLLGSSAFTITSDYRRGFTNYDENNSDIIAAAQTHPDRIEAWPTVNPLDLRKLDKLRAFHEMGARGLKLYLGHGFLAPRASSYLFGPIAMDDPTMDPIYDYCSSHCLPVCLHVNPGSDKRGFADEFVSLLSRHPRLLVNAPHWILSTGRPDRLRELLSVFPNLVTDISFGVDEFLMAGLQRISRNAQRIRQIIMSDPSRFLFGTDLVITGAAHKTVSWFKLRVQSYLSLLEADRYETPLVPGQILNGLALPPEVLAQIGSHNYSRFRIPSHEATTAPRPIDWSRLGVPVIARRSGQRLPVQEINITD
jgi:predicted TIM-barrel fold metal-dependent hydrolase